MTAPAHTRSEQQPRQSAIITTLLTSVDHQPLPHIEKLHTHPQNHHILIRTTEKTAGHRNNSGPHVGRSSDYRSRSAQDRFTEQPARSNRLIKLITPDKKIAIRYWRCLEGLPSFTQLSRIHPVSQSSIFAPTFS
ncbi:hypothetical protein PGT21_024121 [Puccinia graminis f. sp. tritici]|uniref:Uncharacterized protein n=1 Tax=Puccinia graminis f. sp. tritici TaxID=56615 RepID=A0A5B0PYK5_PUCGR|nr:hypothetical protein PGT21_024121 [Puccinia graminis f. sp. tritici]KAA1121009.1 hypothetical protein PGTUg99_026269 [Puccinia graminis f. sp. tritici]